jgi:hypothetical protein
MAAWTETRWHLFVLLFLLSIPLFHAQPLISFNNVSARQVAEDTVFSEQCNLTCSNCSNVSVILQYFDGSVWANLTSGNISLNGSQINPVNFTDTNDTIINFTLYASMLSANNSLRCFLVTNETAMSGAEKNISVYDATAPNITLIAPSNTSVLRRSLNLSYLTIDRHLDNCTLWGNFTGTWQANQTQTAVNGTTNSFLLLVPVGAYTWGVTCADTSYNSASSENFTLLAAHDFSIANIYVVPKAIEAANITLVANITNPGNTSVNVSIEFWSGEPGTGNSLGNTTVQLLESWSLTNITLLLQIGLHNFSVVADPGNDFFEYNETNNIANQSVLVSMWQTYYGNTSGNVTLDSSLNFTFHGWYSLNRTGNIYVSDTDTQDGISFTNLYPLGRNMTNERAANTDDDFHELDITLNTTMFTDNVNRSFTINGNPKATEVFTLYSNTISNVPVLNTSDGNYTTGVLWDASDRALPFYNGGQDVVFVAKVKQQVLSEHGAVNYEIQVPARLKNYRESAPTVTFYYEVQ